MIDNNNDDDRMFRFDGMVSSKQTWRKWNLKLKKQRNYKRLEKIEIDDDWVCNSRVEYVKKKEI